MNKFASILMAAVFAVVTISPVALAQDKKKEQVHKGTPEQGTVQKKDQKKDKKKDGTGSATKKSDVKK